MKWFVSMPVWGDWHQTILKNHVFPRLKKMGLEECTFIIHTDEPQRVEYLRELGDVVLKDKPQHNGYAGMNQCHTEAIKMAQGHGILFLPPDCVLSVDAFKRIKEAGHPLIMVCCLRTFGGGEPPEDSEALNTWAVEQLHPNVKGWIWGHKVGTDVIPSNIYFQEGENFWCHAAHLHPLAAVLDRKVGGGKSIDSYLAGAYNPRETWVVEDCEIAMVEITPEDKFKGLVSGGPITVHDCAQRLQGKLHKHNKEFMLHAVRLRGKAGKTTIPEEILSKLK